MFNNEHFAPGHWTALRFAAVPDTDLYPVDHFQAEHFGNEHFACEHFTPQRGPLYAGVDTGGPPTASSGWVRIPRDAEVWVRVPRAT